MCPSNDAAGVSIMDGSQTTADTWGSSLSPNAGCRESNVGADGTSKVEAVDTRVREQRLVTYLEECLKCMTHLRDWLRLLDHELGKNNYGSPHLEK